MCVCDVQVWKSVCVEVHVGFVQRGRVLGKLLLASAFTTLLHTAREYNECTPIPHGAVSRTVMAQRR